MEIENIYLHGGPKGFSFINDSGTQTEYDYFFKRFYDKILKSAVSIQKIDSVHKNLIVESQVINGRQYYDYTFLEYYIYDVNSRPSYIGITIRLNALYLEILELYFVLDTVFKKDIIGNLLMPKDSTFICTNEQIDKALFDKVMTDIVQLCGIILQNTNLKFVKAASGDHAVELNLVDCLPDVFEKNISKYCRVLISIDAPLQREIQSQNKIDAINQQWTNKWNDLQGKYDGALDNTKGLNGTIQSLNNQLSQTQNELQRVKKEYEDFKSANELKSNVINGLKEEKEALLKLAGFIDTLGSKNNKTSIDTGKTENQKEPRPGIRKYLPYIIAAVAAVAVLCCVFFCLRSCSDKSFWQTNQSGDNTSVVVSPETEVTQLPVGPYQVDNPGLGNEGTDTPGTDTPLVNPIDVSNLTIDVKEFTNTNKTMEKNGVYTIRIWDTKKNGLAEGVTGRWDCQVGDFMIADSNSLETGVSPLKNGQTLEIKFYVNGCDTPITRQISVK